MTAFVYPHIKRAHTTTATTTTRATRARAPIHNLRTMETGARCGQACLRWFCVRTSQYDCDIVEAINTHAPGAHNNNKMGTERVVVMVCACGVVYFSARCVVYGFFTRVCVVGGGGRRLAYAIAETHLYLFLSPPMKYDGIRTPRASCTIL